MIIGLTAKNKMCFVDGSLEQPTANSREAKAWECCNNMLIGWIIAALERSIARSVMYYVTAREMWRDLEERFGQTSVAQVYSLHNEPFDIVQESNMSISDYYTKIKSVWDQLDVLAPIPVCSCAGCVCGLTKKVLKSQQDQRVIRFLMKLSETFNQVRTNILMMEDLASASLAYRLLLQEERHHSMSKLNTSAPDSLAFMAAPDRSAPRSFSHSKHAHGHKGMRAISGTKRTPGVYHCDHCHMRGHTIDRCYKLHGYPSKIRPSHANRIAAFATDTSPVGTDIETTGLNKDQFSNLCALLGKRDTLEAFPSTPIDVTTNAAGPLDDTAFASW